MSSDALLIKDAAKLLSIGSTKLYELLREKNVLGKQTNLPRHDLVLAGYFRSEQRKCRMPSGYEKPYWVTVVTDTGITFVATIVNEYKAEEEAKKARAKETAAT